MSTLRLVLLVMLLVTLSACATPGGRLQSAGTTTVFDLQLHTALDWARIKAPRQEIWTIDGTGLNALQIIHAIRPGEHVLLQGRQRRNRPDGPWFQPGQSDTERRDVILDAITQNGWVDVQGNGLQPQAFAGGRAVRFDLSMTASSGLRYRGDVAAIERDGRLTLLIWAAPAEHYHPRDAAAVRELLDSLAPAAR